MKPGSEVLAFTVTYKHRDTLAATVKSMRATAGYWFDWAVWAGAPGTALTRDLEGLLADPQRLGIQYLTTWPQNRGQHHAMREAMALARENGYRWLLRIDDDVTAKTKRWLKKMLERLETIAHIEPEEKRKYRFVAGPKMVGLKNPIHAVARLEKPKEANAVIVPAMGGGCRLHSLEILEGYEPPLYEPVGRGDPDSLGLHLSQHDGAFLRFEDIRVVHDTERLQSKDTPEQAHARMMGWYWPYLGEGA